MYPPWLKEGIRILYYRTAEGASETRREFYFYSVKRVTNECVQLEEAYAEKGRSSDFEAIRTCEVNPLTSQPVGHETTIVNPLWVDPLPLQSLIDEDGSGIDLFERILTRVGERSCWVHHRRETSDLTETNKSEKETVNGNLDVNSWYDAVSGLLLRQERKYRSDGSHYATIELHSLKPNFLAVLKQHAMIKICPECLNVSRRSAHFCSKCGVNLHGSGGSSLWADADIVFPDGSLLAISDSTTVVGRDLLRDYTMEPNRIDKKQFVIYAEQWTGQTPFYIEDGGSTEGTLLNGNQIRGSARQSLKDGDEISLPGLTLKVRILPFPALRDWWAFSKHACSL